MIHQVVLLMLKTSDKTLRGLIHELNTLLNPSEIIISSNSGLTFHLGSQMSIDSIYSLFLVRNTEFLIIEHVFFIFFNTLEHLVEHLFISRCTIAHINQNFISN